MLIILFRFYDKTLNEWDCRDGFKKVDGKYDLVHLDYGTETQNQNAAPQPDTQPPVIVESMLPTAVQVSGCGAIRFPVDCK